MTRGDPIYAVMDLPPSVAAFLGDINTQIGNDSSSNNGTVQQQQQPDLLQQQLYEHQQQCASNEGIMFGDEDDGGGIPSMTKGEESSNDEEPYRSRCNTWPRLTFSEQQEQQQQQQQQQDDHCGVGGSTSNVSSSSGNDSGISSAATSTFGGIISPSATLGTIGSNPFGRHAFLQQRRLSKERSLSGDEPNGIVTATNAAAAQSPVTPGLSGPPLLPLVSEEDNSASIEGDESKMQQDDDIPQEFRGRSASSSHPQPQPKPLVDFATSGVRPKTSSRRNPWGNMSYADLITQAIQSSPDQRLTLAQIYDWLVKNVSYFRAKADTVSSIGWKVRQNKYCKSNEPD